MGEVLHSQSNADAVLAYFRKQASTYSTASAAGLWAWQRQRETSTLAALAGDVKGHAAVDLGCGTGFYAVHLADAGARPVMAVDALPEMISAISDPRIETVVGDIASIALKRSFRLAMLAGVLEFVGDPVAVLINARRHLEPDGRIVALVPRDNLAGRLYRRFHRRHGFAVTLFDRPSFALMAEHAGLALMQSQAVLPFGDAHLMVAR